MGWLRFALPAATIVLLICVPLLMLLTPFWVHAALDLSGGLVVGGDRVAAHAASDATVAQLLFGGDFTVTGPDGSSLLTADEVGHMHEVRLVLWAFLALTAVSAAVVAYSLLRGGRRAAAWNQIRRGATWLVVGIVVLAVVGVLAFGVAFELFHRILFPGGNWAFPADSNLIRLYPYSFWQLSAAALGVLAIAAAALVRVYAGRQMRKQIWT